MQRTSAPQRPAAALSSRLATRGANAAAMQRAAPRPLHVVVQPGVYAEAMKASRWKTAYSALVARNVRGVSASEAANLMRWPRSYVLVDVRRTEQFAAFHATGSRNAPLYRLIEPTSPWALLRSAAFQAQNVDVRAPAVTGRRSRRAC